MFTEINHFLACKLTACKLFQTVPFTGSHKMRVLSQGSSDENWDEKW